MLVRTQVLFPKELLYQLRAEAARKKTSVSKLVRTIVAKKAVKSKQATGMKALEWLAKHAIKGKGPRDLSTNDEYLYKLP